jgi:anti-sigma factor RsiW
VSCRPELVTGYVDGALDDALQAEVGRHLEACPACREQAEFERRARSLLRALPLPEARPGFEAGLRERLRTERPSRRRWLLPLAAGLAALLFWGRSSASFVALELSLDHAKCFSRGTLPAKLWTTDPDHAARWFQDQGTPLPHLPPSAGGLTLVGARYCPLLDRQVAHLYYTSDGRHLSVYVVPGTVRGDDGFARRLVGRHVRLETLAGQHVGIVAEHREDVAAFARALTTTVAFRFD